MSGYSAVDVARLYGFRLVPWKTFSSFQALPFGLYERALEQKQGFDAKGSEAMFVLFDPNDDADGWIVVGNDPEEMALSLADEGVSQLRDFPMRDRNPLSKPRFSTFLD